MRGTRWRLSGTKTLQRFIPAYAGNALIRPTKDEIPAVHPRVCGERFIGSFLIHPTCGSSPRMRGTPDAWFDCADEVRFIPAYAGNASAQPNEESAKPVHPRVCGERDEGGKPAYAGCGSSPRMRGTQMPNAEILGEARFIPAYAGNAHAPTLSAAATTVHPRVCGERVHFPE